MKTIIHIHDPGSIDQIVAEIFRGPVLVQLPRVFVLLAAPTSKGVMQLNQLKERKPNKNYGTAIGDLNAFLECAEPDLLPDEFAQPADFVPMTGTFLRVHFTQPSFNSPVIRNGTHQGVLLTGIHRKLFIAIEEAFRGTHQSAIWGGKVYNAPLCTSCNMSGDPAGSITDMVRAVEFAEKRKVSMLVTGEQAIGEKGSYPIFGIYPEKIEIHRQGPCLEDYKSFIPKRLRSW